MRYLVAQRWTGGKRPVEISKADFQAIRQAKRGVVCAMLFEEKLDLVLDNFIEYEGEFLRLTLRSAVFEETDWSDFRDTSQQANRRLANLLTTCRLYLDQSPHLLSTLKDPALVEAFKAQTHIEFDNRLGYETMEALRNYFQHRDLPVTGVSYQSAWVPEVTREWRKHILIPTVDLDRLECDESFTRRFKQITLPKLWAKGKDLDWKVLVREYISGIGSVHRVLRELLAPRVKAWDERLLRTLQSYRKKTRARLQIGVEVLAVNSRGRVTEEIQVFTGPIERRKALERKNRTVGYWTKILITSE